MLRYCSIGDVVEDDDCRSREMAIMKNKIVIKCKDSLNNIQNLKLLYNTQKAFKITARNSKVQKSVTVILTGLDCIKSLNMKFYAQNYSSGLKRTKPPKGRKSPSWRRLQFESLKPKGFRCAQLSLRFQPGRKLTTFISFLTELKSKVLGSNDCGRFARTQSTHVAY